MIKVGCVALIENSAKDILITERAIPPFKNLYVMPGGNLKDGESVFDCVKREVWEEVGLTIYNPSLFDIFEVFFNDFQYLIIFFKSICQDFNLKIDKSEVLNAEWVNRNNFQNFPLTEGTNYILSKHFNIESHNLKGYRDFRDKF